MVVVVLPQHDEARFVLFRTLSLGVAVVVLIFSCQPVPIAVATRDGTPLQSDCFFHESDAENMSECEAGDRCASDAFVPAPSLPFRPSASPATPSCHSRRPRESGYPFFRSNAKLHTLLPHVSRGPVAFQQAVRSERGKRQRERRKDRGRE